ncbi:MAG: SpoIID/LytB domain-containing protein [Actinobacteria bacterium]|nr:SpoIID/LytB domain-containing protein [Actinomycetota bacterium]
MRHCTGHRVRRACAAVGMILAGTALAGPSAADPIPTADVIRVRLTVPSSGVSIEPAPSAQVRVDGMPLAGADPPARIVAGAALRYVMLPRDRIPPEAQGLGVEPRTPLAGTAEVMIGPYRDASTALAHRRRLQAEFGAPGRLTPPRAGVAIGHVRWEPAPRSIEIAPASGLDVTRINGRAYRGAVRVSAASDAISVVNTVDLTHYIASVVGTEMPASWELEALKAQAVAARTYALRRIQPDADYDICDSQDCQAYAGVARESPRTLAAAEQTARIVAVYRGALIEAVYSANAGDFTASAEHVWGDAVPYLVEVPSSGDKEALSVEWGATGYRWTREVPLAEVSRAQAVARAGLGAIVSARVVEANGSGRPIRVELADSSRRVELFGDAIRTTLGLPSNYVELTVAAPDVRRLIGPAPTEVAGLVQEGFAVTVRRRSFAFDAAPPDVRLIDGTIQIVTLTKPARLVVRGRGFGHGVGMSQWGAQGMARAGSTYDEILRHYYPGIDLITT